MSSWEQHLVNSQVNVNRAVFDMNKDGTTPDWANDYGDPDPEYILNQIHEAIRELVKAKDKLEEAIDSQRSLFVVADDEHPWPLHDVLRKFIETSDILLKEKGYDGHGYEEIVHATKRAKELLNKE